MNTYNLRTLQGLLQSTDIHSGRRYTVHRTPYSGSPGAWPAPLARTLPFRRYTPKTPKTPPLPPLPLPLPRRAVRCPRSIFFKIEFSHRPFSRPLLYTPPPNLTFTLPEPDLTSLLQPARLDYITPARRHSASDRAHFCPAGGQAGAGVRSLSERASERAYCIRARVFPFFFFFFC